MVKIAVIGCGKWGKNLVRNFANLGSLATICCENKQNIASLAEQFCILPSDYESILKNESIEAVAIATHSHTHADLTRKALLHGKHVYVEKPIALNFTQAQDLVSLAKKNKRLLMTGHLLQYHPVYLTMKDHLRNQLIGPVRKIHARRLFMGRIRPTEDVIWDLLPHDLSMILSILRRPTKNIQAYSSSTFGSCADTVEAVLTFDPDITAYVSASWSFPFKEQSLTVIGETGILIFDDTRPWAEKLIHIPLTLLREQEDLLLSPQEIRFLSVEPDEPLKQECAHFIECIRQGCEPRTGAKEFLPVIALCQNIQDYIGEKNHAYPA